MTEAIGDMAIGEFELSQQWETDATQIELPTNTWIEEDPL